VDKEIQGRGNLRDRLDEGGRGRFGIRDRGVGTGIAESSGDSTFNGCHR